MWDQSAAASQSQAVLPPLQPTRLPDSFFFFTLPVFFKNMFWHKSEEGGEGGGL